MAAQPVLRVQNWREVNRAFNKVNKEAAKGFRAEFAKAAEPVAAEARSRIGVYRGASVNTIGPRSVTGGVFVTQRARKRTGKRGDFGGLQMRHMLGALFDQKDEVEQEIEDALDRLGRSAGF